MKIEKKTAASDVLPLHYPSALVRYPTSRPWCRLPAFVKIILTVPLVMALLSAEIELDFAPQLDVILTVIGVWAVWAWLTSGKSGPL